MNKLEKINTILIYKRVIKAIEKEVKSAYFICNLIQGFDISGKEQMDAINYLHSHKPTNVYLKEFYNNDSFIKTYSVTDDNFSRGMPWWNSLLLFKFNEQEYKAHNVVINKQRVLFLRVLIDKLSK